MTALTIRTPSLMSRTAFEQMFDQFFGDHNAMVKRSTSGYPITDIYKDEENNQVIEMALAGFTREDINIEVKENKISISHRAEPWNGEDRPPRRIAKRSFDRAFVDYHNQFALSEASATFENGLLKITIPPVAEKKTLVIDIK